MQPEQPFPFADFLAELRVRGFGIGLHDYKDVARLISRWQGTDRATLRDALAALLARNVTEVEQIRQAFDEWASVEPPPDEVPPPPRPPPRIRPWQIALVLLLVAAAAAAGTWRYFAKKHEENVRREQLTRPTAPAPDASDPASPPAPPPFPDPPREPARERPWIVASILGSITLLIFAVVEARRRQSRWTSKYWKHVLASMPGPHHYQHRLPEPPELFPRRDIEDVATILGRAREENPAVGETLDADESLRLTLREGMRPHLVFEPPPRNLPVVVLQDVSWSMRPWQRKIDYFAGELARQGVVVDRWYFDSDPLRVSRTPHDRLVALEHLAVTRASESSLMILSTGQAVPAASLEELARLLKKWTFRTWIHPVANPAYWRREAASLPVRMWPMTRAGVMAAAVEISRKLDSGQSPLGAASPRSVTRGDIERMKQLIALVPHPSLELAEDLRLRFARDVPEEVMLFLGAEGVFYGSTIRFPPEQLQQLLDAAAEDPAREREVRRYLLDVLRESEPPEASVAHLRWQLDEAMHRLQLSADDAEAARTLQSLAEGPLRAEVEAALGLMHSKPPVSAAPPVPSTLPVQPPKSLGRRPPLFAWPRWRDVVVAAIVMATASLLLGKTIGAEEGDPIPHQRDYVLEPGFKVRSYRNAPRTAVVHRDGEPWRTISIPDGGTFEIPESDRGAWFDVRAELPRGNLAVSEQLWVPGAEPESAVMWIPDALTTRLVEVTQQVFGVTPDYGTRFKRLRGDFEKFYGELDRRFAPYGSVPRDKYETFGDYATAIRKAIPNGPALLTFEFVDANGKPARSYGFRLIKRGSEEKAVRGVGGTPLDIGPGEYGVARDNSDTNPFTRIKVDPYELGVRRIELAPRFRGNAVVKGAERGRGATVTLTTGEWVNISASVERRSPTKRLEQGEWVRIEGFLGRDGKVEAEKITPIPTPPGQAGLRTSFESVTRRGATRWTRQHGGVWRVTYEWVGQDPPDEVWSELRRITIDGTTGVIARKKGEAEAGEVFIPDHKGGPKDNVVLIYDRPKGEWRVLVDLPPQ